MIIIGCVGAIADANAVGSSAIGEPCIAEEFSVHNLQHEIFKSQLQMSSFPLGCRGRLAFTESDVACVHSTSIVGSSLVNSDEAQGRACAAGGSVEEFPDAHVPFCQESRLIQHGGRGGKRRKIECWYSRAPQPL